MSRQTIYIAGPMSGKPEFNFHAFFAAQKRLEAQGWKVFNPARKDMEKTIDPEAAKTGDHKMAIAKGFDFREAFAWDLCRIVEGHAIYMLSGWEHSVGACAEHAVAKTMQKHYPDFVIIYQ